MKEYVLENRTIVATEKAYNVLYKEQGFKPKKSSKKDKKVTDKDKDKNAKDKEVTDKDTEK